MRDENIGRALLCFQRVQQIQNRGLHRHIQGRGDLITQHNFTIKVCKTDWLAQVENILLQARKVATLITEEKSNVLVYCHLGTSGTPLLTSLAQLFCEPYYRTFEGFKILVHKEWSYYLHNFLKKGLVLVDAK